jgi:hypothetical protein
MLFSGSSAKRIKCMKDNVYGGHAHMAHVSIRHAEPEDCEALHQIFSGPRDRRHLPPLRFPKNGAYVDAYAMASIK